MADGWSGFWRRFGRADDTPPEVAFAGERPLGCDWVWRPGPWREPIEPVRVTASGAGVAPGVTVFHDAAASEISLYQNPAGDGFALCCAAGAFDGTFVSLSIELPTEGLRGLTRKHVIRAVLSVDPGPVGIFCRLNLRHGPNVEQVLRGVPAGGGVAAFDLAYTRMNEKRLEQAWLDVILEAPRQDVVTLRDLVVLRHPRADI